MPRWEVMHETDVFFDLEAEEAAEDSLPPTALQQTPSVLATLAHLQGELREGEASDPLG